MPKSSFSWLHLTDFHYGLKGQDCLWPTLREPFLESLVDLHERCGPWDAVLFTGDLVQSGETAQFKKMQAEVLDPLWEKLNELGSGNAVLLAVPGNHDLYRRPDPQKEDNPALDTLLEEGGFQRIEAKFWDYPAGGYRRAINDAFAAYTQWWGKVPHRPGDVKAGVLPGDFSVTLLCNGRRIGIVGLNTTFLQLTGGDYEGRLVWNARQLQAVCEGGVDTWTKQHDVCLLLTHQGPNWLTPEALKHGESEIAPAGRFAVHLFGHQHEMDIKYIRSGGSRQAVRLCQGCSVFGMEKFGEPPKIQRAHGYAAGRIEFGGKNTYLRLWPRIATDKTGAWRFVPDFEHADLENDQGTPPESVASRPRIGGTRKARSTVIVAAAAEVSSAALDPIAPHSTLPAQRPFFGRVKDLEKIAKYLLPEDRSWGVVLDGPGGVGKTTLALEAAHRALAEHYPLKLWFTAKDRELLPHGVQPLQDHRVESFHALLNEIGRALGRDYIPKAIPEDRPQLVRYALASYSALLVLDNLETFSPEERRRVFELLNNLPSTCRAIVTSRRRTDGSTAAHNLRLDKLERDAADELLSELGRRWEPVARLTWDDRDRLYAETGGNPLLLTWVAGQLGRTTGRCRTIDEAIGRLQEAHHLQQVDEKNDPLDFVFGDLVETFTKDETAVLASLVHFTRPAPVDWLLPLTGLSRKAAETALDGLRDRALLVEDDEAGTWLLPSLAALFLRRIRPKAVGISGKRLADRTYALAVENGYEEYSRFPNLEAAWPQLAAAFPVLIAGDNQRLQTVCDALEVFLNFSGRWDDWLTLSTEAEAKAVSFGDFKMAGRRAFSAGFCHFLRNQSAEVFACADRAATHWEASKANTYEQATVLRLRGLGKTLEKDFLGAIADFQKALLILKNLYPKSDPDTTVLNDLAETFRASGHLAEAEAHYREALAIAKTSKDVRAACGYTSNLAELMLDRKQWPEAESLSREALREAEHINEKMLIAFACLNLALALARQGRGSEGRYHAERAVKLFYELRYSGLIKAQAALEECLAS
ncbi:MAG TPA: tetratricopeptide repeat protein [Thermoanaerobaculia bacterium]